MAEMNFIFNPIISTIVISRNQKGGSFLDLLISTGGFISILWFVILPIGKNTSRKLYDANLVSGLYFTKDKPSTIILSPEEI